MTVPERKAAAPEDREPGKRRKMTALVDCNSFYASCEKVFRPDLANSPVVVLSNNDGCIVAMSREAKGLNIPRGAPPVQGQGPAGTLRSRDIFLQLCPLRRPVPPHYGYSGEFYPAA